MPNFYRLYGLESASAAGASADAQRASTTAHNAELRVRALEESLAKTLMICEALWELVRDKGGLTDADLFAKIQEVDLRDGVLDGKNQVKAFPCPQCQRTVSTRHARCLYCGHTFSKSTFDL